MGDLTIPGSFLKDSEYIHGFFSFITADGLFGCKIFTYIRTKGGMEKLAKEIFCKMHTGNPCRLAFRHTRYG